MEKNSTGLLARVIRESCLRVQSNLETAVKFLLRPRRPGLSIVLWLPPKPAKTDHFFAGVNKSALPLRTGLGGDGLGIAAEHVRSHRRVSESEFGSKVCEIREYVALAEPT